MRRYYIAVAVLAVCSAAALVTFQIFKQGFDADRETVDQLQRIERAVRSYERETGMLPAALSSLPDTRAYDGVGSIPLDRFEYRLDDTLFANSYTICAVFHTGPTAAPTDTPERPFTDHGKGRDCFKREFTRQEPARTRVY